jgi:hypothetical protein
MTSGTTYILRWKTHMDMIITFGWFYLQNKEIGKKGGNLGNLIGLRTRTLNCAMSFYDQSVFM